jgi:hypothetical protein
LSSSNPSSTKLNADLVVIENNIEHESERFSPKKKSNVRRSQKIKGEIELSKKIME